jgi:hypothetical protein
VPDGANSGDWLEGQLPLNLLPPTATATQSATTDRNRHTICYHRHKHSNATIWQNHARNTKLAQMAPNATIGKTATKPPESAPNAPRMLAVVADSGCFSSCQFGTGFRIGIWPLCGFWQELGLNLEEKEPPTGGPTLWLRLPEQRETVGLHQIMLNLGLNVAEK